MTTIATSAARAAPEKEERPREALSTNSAVNSATLSEPNRHVKSAHASLNGTPQPPLEPPHSDEAEKGLLGSALIDPDVLALCEGKLGSRDFYVPAHQTIYTILVERWNAGQAIDLITFTQTLRDGSKISVGLNSPPRSVTAGRQDQPAISDSQHGISSL